MTQSSTLTIPATLRAPVLVADDFLTAGLARAMRADVDTHFALPNAHRSETHQVWAYWFRPGMYTYLRTDPGKIIHPDRMKAFMQALRNWSLLTIGMGAVSAPNLRLYVAGCHQEWQSDAINSRFAFVYLLTNDTRRSAGGETLVMREGDPFRTHLRRPAGGGSFYEAIAPRFNRLVVFDGRMPNAVEAVTGAMDPIEGHLVLQGNLSEAGTAVTGALSANLVGPYVADALRAFAAEAPARASVYQGSLSLRLTIAPTGQTQSVDIMLDRVVHLDSGHTEWEPLRARLIDRLGTLRFPPAAGVTTVIQPVMFGQPVTPSLL